MRLTAYVRKAMSSNPTTTTTTSLPSGTGSKLWATILPIGGSVWCGMISGWLSCLLPLIRQSKQFRRGESPPLRTQLLPQHSLPRNTGGHAWCCVYFRKKTGIRMTGSGLTGVVLLVGSHRSPLAIRQRQNLSVQSQERRGQSRYPQILHQTRSATCTRLSSHSLPVSSSNRSRRLFRAPSRSEVLQDMFTTRKDETFAQSTTSNVRNSQFQVVHNKRTLILDAGHPAGWINRTTLRTRR